MREIFQGFGLANDGRGLAGFMADLFWCLHWRRRFHRVRGNQRMELILRTSRAGET
jgi:hypothetical protein